MILFVIFYFLSTVTRIHSATVTSPQIRILDVATKASETRLIPNRIEYRNPFHHYFHPPNPYAQTTGPIKSYVIYDDYPQKIIKEWKANPPAEFPVSNLQNFLELSRQPNVDTAPAYYFQNSQLLPPTKPTLAYSSVYSNVIKVFDNSLDNLDRNHFQSEKYVRPFEGSSGWKNQPPNEYESMYLQDLPRRQMYHNLKLPENFPKVFSPNEKFHFPSFEEAIPQPPKFFYPQEGYYDTYTVNYNKENTRHRDEVEVLSEVNLKPKNQKKTFLCSFIKVNQRYFPQEEGPCGRTDELPIVPPQYPDYSNLPNDKIPVEHRRHHFQIKRIKRSEFNESYETRQKRNAGFGYGYSGWGSPFGYESGYDGYFGDNYPSRGGYRSNYNSGYYSNRNRNQDYRGKYNSGSRYDDYDDDYQNNDDSNSRGLTGYLTNGGRRYKNRKNNNDEDDDDDDDNNNENNRDDDSDEEMERMNSNRRDTNDRRNNDDSRDRRRNNNNYNDDDDYRDSRRNNNRNNNNNSRRNNNNNNNNSNSRRYNDRNDYNNNRNRYYGNSNGYNNNGYGSGYGSYGSNYRGGYGSSYGNNGGYGSSYGNNGGYGSSYGNNGGYGYGGYGNGFGSF